MAGLIPAFRSLQIEPSPAALSRAGAIGLPDTVDLGDGRSLSSASNAFADTVQTRRF